MLRADVVLVLVVPGLCEVHGAESFSRFSVKKSPARCRTHGFVTLFTGACL